MNDARQIKRSYDETRCLLADCFPLAIASKGQKPRPLATDIFRQIEAAELLSERQIAEFIYQYCATASYLKALLTHDHRYNLDGTIAGKVGDGAKAYARIQLARMDRDERRKLELQKLRRENAELRQLLAMHGHIA